MRLFLLITVLAFACAVQGIKCPEKSDADEDNEFEKISEKEKDIWDKAEKETAKHSFAFKAKTKDDRKKIFKEKAKEAKEANKKNPKFCQEPNELDTMDDDEVEKTFNGVDPAEVEKAEKDLPPEPKKFHGFGDDPVTRGLPSSVDNRASTGSVEHQGGCGSCWAFAASHTLTGVVKLMGKGGVNDYSEQQITDCVYPTKGGCQGGWPMKAFEYLKGKSAMPENQYPYTGKSGAGSCKDQRASGNPPVTDYKYARGEAEMRAVVAKHPVTVAMMVGKGGFGRYKSGVYDFDGDCPGVNHAMTVVGYGRDSEGGNYWLVKNSWGGGWGDNGYIKVARGKNLCSIEKYGMYPVVRSHKGEGGGGGDDNQPTTAAPSAWKKFKSLEYIYTGASTDFELSEQYCMQNQGSMASISSSSQNSLVKELVWNQLRLRDSQIWIGLNDREREGQWKWTDGKSLTYKKWARGEPNNSGNEDCVTMSRDGSWNDMNCHNPKKYVCVRWTGGGGGGDDTTTRRTTQATTRRTTQAPSDCQDKSSNCKHWTKYCTMSGYSHVKNKYCRKTCGACGGGGGGGGGDCQDKSSNCKDWTKYCTIQDNIKNTYCRKTCGAC